MSMSFKCGKFKPSVRIGFASFHILKRVMLSQIAPDLVEEWDKHWDFLLSGKERNLHYKNVLRELQKRELFGCLYFCGARDVDWSFDLIATTAIGKTMSKIVIPKDESLHTQMEEIRKVFMYAKQHRVKHLEIY